LRKRDASNVPAGNRRIEKPGVQQQPDAALAHHLEQQRLVDLGVERRDRRT